MLMHRITRRQDTITNPIFGVHVWTGWLGGFLVALYALVGRWSPARLVVESEEPGLQPRHAIVVCLVFMVILSLWSRFTSRWGVDKYARWTVTAVFVFLGYTMLSAIWAPDSDHAVRKAADLAVEITATLCAYVLLTKTDLHAFAKGFWGTVLVFGSIMAGLAAVLGSPGRAAVLGGGPNVFGRLMTLLCLAALRAFISSRHYFLAVVWVFLAAIGAQFIVMSGSRGALVGFFCGVASFLILVVRRNIKKVVVMSLALVGVVALLLNTDVGRKARLVYEERFLELTIRRRYDADRKKLLSVAWEAGTQSPMFGMGLSGFEDFPGSGEHRYPHNMFAEAFAEGGIVGLVLLCMPFLLLTLELVSRRTPLDPVNFGAFCAMFVAAQFSGDLYDSRNVFLFLVWLSVTHARILSSSRSQYNLRSQASVRYAPSVSVVRPRVSSSFQRRVTR